MGRVVREDLAVNAWVLRQLENPDGPEQFAEALGVVERMANALEFLARCDACTAGNANLRTSIHAAITDFRKGPQ
jgi:hypothetical protein